MKSTLVLTAALAALSLAGCKKEAGPVDDTAASPGVTADNGFAPVPATPATSAGQAFADTAAASDKFEIETSKLAATKAESAKVKRFAEQMIKAHTESTTKLKAAASAASPAIAPTEQMTAPQQQTLTDLGAKSGSGFDAAYKKAQVDGHQMTLDALKSYAATGDVPQLKDFASDMVPVVTAHLNMAKGL